MQGPIGPGGDNLRYVVLARNKKNITLNLDTPKGRDLFRRMLEKSDVVVENYSPPVKEKLGLDYDTLTQSRPDIILVSISAFGNNGPYRDRLGFDPIVQAESGTMSIIGFPDSVPTRSQIAWVDVNTATQAALGTVLALMHRERTGEGQCVELALMDTAVACFAYQGTVAEYEVLGLTRPRLGNGAYHFLGDTFEAKDGLVMMVVLSDPLWRRLARLLERPELVDDPRLKDDTARWQNRHLVEPLVKEWVGRRTVTEVLDATTRARIPCGRVNDVGQMLSDAQVKFRELFQQMEVPGIGEVGHPRLAVRLSHTPATIRTPARRTGEDNGEIYRQMVGLSDEELAAFRAEGVL